MNLTFTTIKRDKKKKEKKIDEIRLNGINVMLVISPTAPAMSGIKNFFI